ncbi:MAG: hypothetical protein ACJ71F_00195 [Nitrososphaeraceae archaeon]
MLDDSKIYKNKIKIQDRNKKNKEEKHSGKLHLSEEKKKDDMRTKSEVYTFSNKETK